MAAISNRALTIGEEISFFTKEARIAFRSDPSAYNRRTIHQLKPEAQAGYSIYLMEQIKERHLQHLNDSYETIIKMSSDRLVRKKIGRDGLLPEVEEKLKTLIEQSAAAYANKLVSRWEAGTFYSDLDNPVHQHQLLMHFTIHDFKNISVVYAKHEISTHAFKQQEKAAALRTKMALRKQKQLDAQNAQERLDVEQLCAFALVETMQLYQYILSEMEPGANLANIRIEEYREPYRVWKETKKAEAIADSICNEEKVKKKKSKKNKQEVPLDLDDHFLQISLAVPIVSPKINRLRVILSGFCGPYGKNEAQYFFHTRLTRWASNIPPQLFTDFKGGKIIRSYEGYSPKQLLEAQQNHSCFPGLPWLLAHLEIISGFSCVYINGSSQKSVVFCAKMHCPNGLVKEGSIRIGIGTKIVDGAMIFIIYHAMFHEIKMRHLLFLNY